MRIAVLGPGALGCLRAARLAEAGEEAVLLDHDAARAASVAETGVQVETSGRLSRVDVPIVARPDGLSGVDLLLVTVKAYDTETAVGAWKGVLGGRAVVLTLQNGLGNVEAILERTRGGGASPPARVVAGATAEGATLRGPGHTVHAGTGPTVLAAARGGREAAEEAAEPLLRAGLDVRVEDDPEAVIWSKLLVNVGVNALAGVLGLPNGELGACEDARPVMDELVDEAVRVAERRGVALAPGDPAERARGVLRRTASNVNSLLQDLRRGRRTEIDALNGRIVEAGHAAGVPTPVNRALWAMVRALEIRSRKA